MKNKIYVRYEQDGNENYPLAFETLEDAVEEEGVSRIGIYRLETVEYYKQVVAVVRSEEKKNA